MSTRAEQSPWRMVHPFSMLAMAEETSMNATAYYESKKTTRPWPATTVHITHLSTLEGFSTLFTALTSVSFDHWMMEPPNDVIVFSDVM